MHSYMAYQFKVTLEDIEPPVWRRFQVPKTATMADFSFAIEDSMKWSGTLLHRFIVERSIPVPDYDNGEWYDMLTEIPLQSLVHNTLEYEYNIGDDLGTGWMLTIKFEGEVESDCEHPVCLDGERCCPPESLKGYAKAYDEFLRIVMDEEHPDRDEVLYINHCEDTGFDPNVFDKQTVRYRKYVPCGAKKIYW